MKMGVGSVVLFIDNLDLNVIKFKKRIFFQVVGWGRLILENIMQI